PAACPAADELSFRVERALERPLAAVAPVRFDVSIRAAHGRFAAVLQTRDGGAAKDRRLAARDCSQLLDGLSCAIVLAVAAFEAQDTESAAPDTASSAASSPPSAASNGAGDGTARDAPEAVASSQSDGHIAPGVIVTLVGDVGSLPSPGVGVAVGA